MAERGFPLAGSNINTEDDWRLFIGKLVTSGVWAGYLNTLTPSADGSGMTVKVDSGGAVLMGFYYQSDALRTLAVTAAHATLPRIDTIVLRLNRGVSPFIYTTTVLAGTANASPVPPTLTQTTTLYELPLADVRVNAAVGTIAADKITDRRTYAVPALSPGSIGSSLLAAGAVTPDKLSVGYQPTGAADTDIIQVRGTEIQTSKPQGIPTYNANGAVATVAIKDATGVTTVKTFSFTYNADGTMATSTVAAPTAGVTITTTYTYTNGRLTSWSTA